MKDRLKVLHVALEKGNYELAAHALVYGMVKASIEMKNASPRHCEESWTTKQPGMIGVLVV